MHPKLLLAAKISINITINTKQMNIAELFGNKSIKPKQKTEILSKHLLSKTINTDNLIAFAATAKDSDCATCIEALEFAGKQQPAIADEKVFQFVTQSLMAKAPRVQWESAKVIGNTAHLFTNQLDDAIKNLLVNTEHPGTVVRWSAAFALGEIVKLKTKHNKPRLRQGKDSFYLFNRKRAQTAGNASV